MSASKSRPSARRRPSSCTSVAGNDWPCASNVPSRSQYGATVERHARAFAVDDESRGDALHASHRRAASDATERDVRHLVADQAVEDAPTFLRLDELHVEVAPVVDGVGDRLVGDLVEHHALHGHGRLQHLEQVPRDRLALAVLVGREVELARVLERGLELGDDVLLVVGDDVDGTEVVVDVDAEPAHLGLGDALRRLLGALGQVADVPDAGLAPCRGRDRGSRRWCRPSLWTRRSREVSPRGLVLGLGWIGRPVWSAGGGGKVSAPDSGAGSGRCQLRVVPVDGGTGRLSCAVVHLLSTHSRAQSGSEGDPQRPEPVRRDRADVDHLRRDRAS